MCLFPRSVKITLKDGNEVRMNVPCGKCIDCLKLRVNDWVYRLKIENKFAKHSVFVTLTYDDFFVPNDGVQVHDLQKHFKRLRKRLDSVRYFAIGEYGTKTNRPHYHYLLFTNDDVTYHDLITYIHESWNFGFISCKVLTTGRIIYCITYLQAQHHPEGKNKPFCVMSKRPALGSQILNDETFVSNIIKNDFNFVLSHGYKMHVPRYYKKKLCDKDFTIIDYYLLKCANCKKEYENKLEYLKTHDVRNRKDFLHNLGGTANGDLVDYGLYVHAENVNKDFTLKQRNKKTRLL